MHFDSAAYSYVSCMATVFFPENEKGYCNSLFSFTLFFTKKILKEFPI